MAKPMKDDFGGMSEVEELSPPIEDAVAPVEHPEVTKVVEETKVDEVAEVSEVCEAAMLPFWERQVLSLEEYSRRIARNNVSVVLHIGRGTPTAIETQLYEVASEIKAAFTKE